MISHFTVDDDRTWFSCDTKIEWKRNMREEGDHINDDFCKILCLNVIISNQQKAWGNKRQCSEQNLSKTSQQATPHSVMLNLPEFFHGLYNVNKKNFCILMLHWKMEFEIR